MTARSIRSAERALRLFELFAHCQTRLTVSEVADALGIPRPVASDLVTTLASLGYLDHSTSDRTYAPTIRVALLAGWLGPCLQGGRSLGSRLEELHAETGEDVFVGIQNGASMQIVQGRGRNHKLSIDSGRMLSLTRTALGQALLSGKSNPEILDLVRRCNAEAETNDLKVDEAAFLEIVADVRRKGYALQQGYQWAQRTGLSICIATSSGPDFAVGCAGPSPQIQAKQDLILGRLRALQASYLGGAPVGPLH